MQFTSLKEHVNTKTAPHRISQIYHATINLSCNKTTRQAAANRLLCSSEEFRDGSFSIKARSLFCFDDRSQESSEGIEGRAAACDFGAFEH